MGCRICERCGAKHRQTNSPLCPKCRALGSKRKCPIEGCDTLISPEAKTCSAHRRLQTSTAYTHCRECAQMLAVPSCRGVCAHCLGETRVLCACGCGRYRRKYGREGQVFEYVSGHNDNWSQARRPPATCAVCGRLFQAATPKTRLCSHECRTRWLTINPPNERKRIRVECAACGKELFRAPSSLHPGRSYACSKQCRYIIVANKVSGPKSDAKKLALRRDEVRCRICGFDILVEVHHITPKRRGGENGTDALENLITLCPNHHTMADRKLIEQDTLRRYIANLVE